MEKPSVIRFADKLVQELFYKLEQGDEQEKEMFCLINQAMDNIEKNAFCGIQVPKKQILKNTSKIMAYQIFGNMICREDGVLFTVSKAKKSILLVSF